ncbi:SLAP domain-containing protein [Bacillota bacterium LX-D]|nr:SLAP domain-containing protein [Bacillota bacterium LX-D]
MLKFLRELLKGSDKDQNTQKAGQTEEQQNYKIIEDGERKVIKPGLSLPKEMRVKTSGLAKQYMEEDLEALPPVKEGDINISGVYAYKNAGKLEVSFYLQNGLNRPVAFEKVPLMLIDSQKKVLARQVFDLSSVGAIDPFGARPCKVFFAEENILVQEIPKDDWRLVFELNPRKVQPELKVELTTWPEDYTEEQVLQVKQFLAQLPPIKAGELNFTPYQCQFNAQGDLIASVLLRNGAAKEVRLEGIPLLIKDAEQKTTAFYHFKLSDCLLKPQSAVLYNLTFPAESVLEKEPNLSKWTLEIKK